MLIKIDDIAAKARAAGFQVNSYVGYLEIFAPNHEGATHVEWYGSVYSSADFIISDRPDGYGYNGFFHGPFHKGYAQHDAHGVQRLFAAISQQIVIAGA